MIRERVCVRETPTEICTAGWSHPAVIVENTGGVDVYIDTSPEFLEEEGQAYGLPVKPGAMVTVPRARDDVSMILYAVTAAGEVGELTYYSPGSGWE